MMPLDEILIDRIKLLVRPNTDWVLFSNGTVVIIDNAGPENNLGEKAIGIMKEFGPVYPGTSAGDMNIKSFMKPYGWLVSGHGPGMYTYVHPDEIEVDNPDHILVGFHGRSKRDRDSRELKIVHIHRKKES